MMMKKYASLLFALVLALSLSVSAAADADVYVYDGADILSTDECAALNEAAAAVSEQYGCGVYVVTVDDMADYIDPDAVTETDETGMAAFTEYAWDALGLAASYDSNGIMLALSMVERDFQMLAHGDTANAAFTDYGKYIMQDEFLDNFREDDWYGGFADYIAACGRYLEANANGAPIDVEPSDETEEEYEPLSFGDKLFFAALMAFRFGLPLGLIVAFIVCAIYKRQLKSVHPRDRGRALHRLRRRRDHRARGSLHPHHRGAHAHQDGVRRPRQRPELLRRHDRQLRRLLALRRKILNPRKENTSHETNPLRAAQRAAAAHPHRLRREKAGGGPLRAAGRVEQPDPPDSPAPSEAEQSLADLRETIRAAGAVLGCAYLGSTGGEESTDLTALLEGADCLTAYPFLREIPAEQVVAPGGWDIYCIVPADENADVAVNEYGWLTEGAELPRPASSSITATVLRRCISSPTRATSCRTRRSPSPPRTAQPSSTSPFSAYGTALSPSPRTARCTTSPFTPKALCVKQPPEPPNPQQIARF